MSEINPSKRGYLEEDRMIERIYPTHDINQYLDNKIYSMVLDSLCTNLKFYLMDEQLTENDCNFSFSKKTMFFKKNTPYFIDNIENIGLQRKDHKNKINYPSAKKDGINFLMAQVINKYLMKNNIILTKGDDDFKLKLKLKYQFNVQIKNYDNFKGKHEVFRKVGENSLAYERFDGKEWKDYKYSLGELVLIDEGLLVEDLKLVNLMIFDSINNETYPLIKEALRMQSIHLQSEYYIYCATNGVSKKANSFLETINAQVLNPDQVINSLKQSTFFNDIQRINFNGYGIRDMVMGNIKFNFSNQLKELSYSDNKIFSVKNLQKSIDGFFD